VRALAFSDLHRDLDGAARLVELARDADVVIGAGDFGSQHLGVEETVSALASIETPTVLVPGNNETDDELRAACAGWPASIVLHGEGAEVAGVSFFGLGGGIPVTPWDWSFDLTEEEAAEKLAECPEGAFLVVHSPPKGHVDNGIGSEAILRTIEERRPALAVCGHIHEQWGHESRVGETRVLNLGPAGILLEL
jgi:uncharacterized protein